MKKTKILFQTVLNALFLLIAGSLLLSRNGLCISHYSVVVPAFSKPVHIVHLSDLHNSEFGPNNIRLIKKVAAQEPDLILITGDLLNQNEERTEVAEELIVSLANIAPIYVSFGNHEAAYEKNYGTDLRALYTAAGATVLESNWIEISVQDQRIRLGGIYGYCLPAKYRGNGADRAAECDYVEAFQDTEDYKLLMCHIPYSWIKKGSLDSWDVDCVLCGHIHGGQVRIPWVGGLWAPDQGWFPGKVSGLYRSKDESRVMVLSRGLGNTDFPPRFNNIPEILVLDLLPS